VTRDRDLEEHERGEADRREQSRSCPEANHLLR
jgi:hypothetical protein